MAGMEHSEKTQRIPKGWSKYFVFSLACPFSAETKQRKLRKLKEIFLFTCTRLPLVYVCYRKLSVQCASCNVLLISELLHRVKQLGVKRT